jgi:hypothetical protein
MYTLDRGAISIPRERLVEGLRERIERKRAVLQEREQTFGKGRPWIGSYMENIALPELFGFDMNDLYSHPRQALELDLRHKAFWLDNSVDDGLPGLSAEATVGHYFDITLFGQEIRHSPQGVPQFMPHPISQTPDLSLIRPFDFHSTGAMAALIRQYDEMRESAQSEYGGAVSITFPSFNRGPLDICVQLRGYDNFVADTVERPEFVREFMALIANERARWRREKSRFLGQPDAASSCYIADDWVNIPFITPAMFREFVLPAYRQIERNEGTVTGFHTCGVLLPVAQDLLNAFPCRLGNFLRSNISPEQRSISHT